MKTAKRATPATEGAGKPTRQPRRALLFEEQAFGHCDPRENKPFKPSGHVVFGYEIVDSERRYGSTSLKLDAGLRSGIWSDPKNDKNEGYLSVGHRIPHSGATPQLNCIQSESL